MRHLYPPPREPLHRLYYEVSPRYIERGDLVDRISDSFNRHPSRPVLLCGASGCGTTQVALRYAQKYGKDYRVMWLIDCADGITARRDLAELAKDLSLPFYNCLRARPDLGHGAAEALRWLDYNADWLLIFDGAKDPGRRVRSLRPAPIRCRSRCAQTRPRAAWSSSLLATRKCCCSEKRPGSWRRKRALPPSGRPRGCSGWGSCRKKPAPWSARSSPSTWRSKRCPAPSTTS